MSPPALPELLTADEVAQIFRVAPATVYRWGQDGTLDEIRVASTIRFRRADVEALLTSGRDRDEATA